MTNIICRNLGILNFFCHDIMYFLKICDIFFENIINYRLKYLFYYDKYRNVQNLSYKNFYTFFILIKLKCVTF